ncbi:MAG: MBL fold metallo-hydrolase [Phycisphaerae bacterium]
MVTFSLQSGSNGNAVYVEANGTRLLFDAGISGKAAQQRAAVHGRDMRDLHAVVISHDHDDHVRCAGVYQRKFNVPIHITRRTHAAIWRDLGHLTDVRYFKTGDALAFGDVTVHTIATKHDAADGAAFVIECDGRRLAILTDLGHPFAALRDVLESVDAAYLECNYDPQMLATGSYPPRLKARIRGAGGHLSNDEAATLLRACGRRRPAWVAVAHLSQENNTPALAIEAQRSAVGRDYPVFLAPRWGCSPLLTL